MAKKVWATIFAFVMLLTCSVVAFATGNDLEILPGSFSIGDVNMDNAVNIKDATAVQKYIVKLESFSEAQLVLADADLSGVVNIKDATYIQKQVVGLVGPAVPDASEETSAQTTSQIDTNTTVTEPTEEPTTVTEATEVTPAQTEEPTTRDPDKPIELPFVPVT